LPSQLTSYKTANVLRENRALKIANGAFTDSFAHEYTWHVYTLSGSATLANSAAPTSPAKQPHSSTDLAFLGNF